MPTYLNETANTITESFKDKNGILEIINIPAGGSLATTYVLTNANLTKTSDSPYFNPIYGEVKTVVSSGPGDDKTVDIHIDTKQLSIWNANDSVLTVYLNANTNYPPILVFPNSEKLIDLNHNVSQLIISFSAAATIYIEQRK
jgi:hypothetical protein